MAVETVSTRQRATARVVDLVAGPTRAGAVDDFELAHARTALARLKGLIGREGLLDLLATEIEEGNAFLKKMARDSQGVFRSATTALAVRGIKSAQFLHWLDNSFGNEAVLLAAEPGHYVIARKPDSKVTVVEQLGTHICHIELPAYDATMSWAAETADEMLPESQYPIRRIAPIRLPDGTLVGRLLHQFGDTDEGFNANLTVYFPVSCPEDFFEEHRQHLAVEFRNWITAAAAQR